ncbi:MAG: S1C family serine protease, partial [bacterium]
MKIHRWFLVFAFLFCSQVFSSTLTQESLPEIVKRVEPSVVVILTYDDKGEALGQGSGFFISQEGDVITNRHVLSGASK